MTLAAALPAFGEGEPTAKPLHFGDGSSWRTLSGQWLGDGAVFDPPATPRVRNNHSRAFYVAEAYADATVEVEYMAGHWEGGAGTAGVIVRAADGGHYYVVQFPFVGQATRSKHFWAGLGKVSGDGYVRYEALNLVPGVPAEHDRWYSVKVETKGPRIRAWVDGRLAIDVTDDTYPQRCRNQPV